MYISSIFNNFFTDISNDTSLLNEINLPGPSTSSILSNKKIHDEVHGEVSESKFYEILHNVFILINNKLCNLYLSRRQY